MAAILYVDGLGLYYGSVKDTPHRWLDIDAFAQTLGFDPPITRVHYFATPAPETARERQLLYLRALRTLKPRVRIHEVDGPHPVAEMSQRLSEDAKAGRLDVAVILSIDGRLASAVEALPKSCILIPRRRNLRDPSLFVAATFPKQISASSLMTSQFPDVLHDSDGEFQKPNGW